MNWIRTGLVSLALSSAPAFATDYYVSPSGSDANNCTAAQNIATPKQTYNSGRGCLSGGDTLYLRAGSYTATASASYPAGPSNSQRTTIAAFGGEAVTVTFSTSSSHGINISGDNYTFYGIDWNGSNLTGVANVFKLSGSGVDNVTISGPAPVGGTYRCKVRDGPDDGVSAQGANTNLLIENCEIEGNGFNATTAPYAHGLYVQNTTSFVMRGNYIHGNFCNGVQIYPGAPGALVQNNKFAGNAVSVNCGTEFNLSAANHTFERNVFDGSSGTATTALRLQNGNAQNNNTIRHNTVYGSYTTQCVYLSSNASNNTLVNNIFLGCSTKVTNLGSGNTLTTNLTTGTPGDVFTSVSVPYNLTLKAGSAAINNGTNISQPYCGAAPDQGAFETPVVTAATIAGNTLDVTTCNIAPPMQPNGTWTPGCTGTGCGTRTATNVSVVGGGLIRVTVDGAACTSSPAQTWTISASGNNTDSAMVGNGTNQPLHTVTNFSVNSSACDGGGGPPPPGSEEAHYEFENNLNDSSGNGNHAIGSANLAGYAPAKTGLGVQFTAGANSYVDTGLLNGYDLGANSLTIAVGVRLAASDLGSTKDILGTALGTNQRLILWKHSGNTWRASVGAVNGSASEFPVVEGDTHLVLQFNGATNTAKLCVNGVEGAVSNASTFSYSDYTLASTLRIGLPSGFATSLSGAHIVGDVRIYQSVQSCADLYAAWEPPTTAQPAVQAGHQWQKVYTSNGVAVNRGAADAQLEVNKGGAVALMVQINNTSGSTVNVQPRFRYNINSGGFNTVVPDTPTADGISYWGASASTILNNGIADGPITGALTHIDGVTTLVSAAVPTLTLANDESYTLRGIFNIDAAIGDVVCFKLYDQSGEALTSYTPTAGACVTVVGPTAAGGF